MSMQQISTMHYGRNSDYANEVMRFPGLEMFIYGEHTTTAENTKFRPIEKSNNHKGFQDSGNVFMRFSGLHLWLYGEQHFFMQLCFAERTVID